MSAAPSLAWNDPDEDKDLLLRELDHRVRNNLSVLLGLVRMNMANPPASASAALARVAGQITALSTIHDLTRGFPGGDRGNAAELFASFIAGIERGLHTLGKIEFSSDAGAAEVPIEAAPTLCILLGEMLFDAIERASRTGKAPEIRVNLSYQGHCRFSLEVADTAPRDKSRLAAQSLATSLGGELITSGGAGFTVRELRFSSMGSDGACREVG